MIDRRTGRDDGRPDPDELLRKLQSPSRRQQAALRIYLGYAFGCGTTTYMLDEARRRQHRGADVVVAAIKSLSPVEASLAGLELLGGPSGLAIRDVLDVPALLARNPEVACIDDLASPDSQGHPRGESVQQLLDAGIALISTAHLLDIEGLRDPFENVTRGRPGRACIRSQIVDIAQEIELVDVQPAALLDRLRAGTLMPMAEAAQALQGEFRLDVLEALRETAFRFVAEQTDRQLVAYMRERRIASPWEARSRVVTCVPPIPHLESQIEQAAAYATRRGAKFTVLCLTRGRSSYAQLRVLDAYAALTQRVGGEFVTLAAQRPAPAIARYVEESLATEVILGHRRRPWKPWDTSSEIIRLLVDVDVHILRKEQPVPPPAAA